MSDLKKKLNDLGKDKIKKDWNKIRSNDGLSTREKLEKLVKQNIGKEKARESVPIREEADPLDDYILREYSYPLESKFGKVRLAEWFEINPEILSVMFKDSSIKKIDPGKFLYFDTETTGLSGGTGTIPFMLGFGFFEEGSFKVKIFVLNNLEEEGKFLDAVNSFLSENDFSATVTYNGKSFDFPLMETRYILNRKRFPLQKIPHLDFLPVARIIWKNTYESRRLGYLGDILLDISRDEDVDGSLIPSLYFSYLRSGNFFLIENIIEHNAMDIVGLSALLLLGVKYMDDLSVIDDEGEIFGIARLYERFGDLEKAGSLYSLLNSSDYRQEIVFQSVKRFAMIKKREHLLKEAKELWRVLSISGDHLAFRELSIHYEHREKNFHEAIEIVQAGLQIADITGKQREDFEKRLKRLQNKINKIVSE